MKKKSYIELKISKKLLKGLIAAGCLLGITTTTAFAYSDYLYDLQNPDEAPIIKTVSARYSKGDFVEPLKLVTAYDKEDGDLTDKITYTAHYYNTEAGEVYEITFDDYLDTTINGAYAVYVFTVSDSDGNSTSTTVSYYEIDNKTNPLANK